MIKQIVFKLLGIKEEPYVLKKPGGIVYLSKRYDKTIVVPEGRESDGATGAYDISGDILAKKGVVCKWTSAAWWVHDELTKKGEWEDGTPVTPLQESMVLYDILIEEGRNIRAIPWGVTTYLFRKIKSLVGS